MAKVYASALLLRDPVALLRPALVLGCALALILAGQPLPSAL